MYQSYLVPDRMKMEESIRLSEETDSGFEYDDFYLPEVLDDEEEVKRRIAFYRSFERERTEDTLHGAFYDVNVASDDGRIREISDFRIRQSMEIAQELGVKAVIFHTNCIAGFRLKTYREQWVERNAAYYDRLLSDYPDREIYVENMFDSEPELLAELAARLKDRKNFGVCLDYAHAVISGSPVEEWVRRTAPFIKHIHINDNDRREDSHLAVGDGAVDWEEYAALMESCGISKRKPGVLLEMAGVEKQKKSIGYMKKKGYFPFV